MTHVLVVCTGNICRSPIAAALLRMELDSRDMKETSVSSAGTGAWDGAPASEGAYLVALEHGVDLSGHRARLLTREVVEGADVIFTMARHQRARVEELGGTGRVHVLGEFAGKTGPDAEVGDPFGADLQTYRNTFEELRGLIAEAAKRLVEERGDEDKRA
ncbi:MAG: low molecular weight protein arginine phosphatase [Gemmatimonadales bacterium]